jgi:uncharacterized protein YjiS (DUF1127 family)
MKPNQKEASREILARTRVALANSARSFETRQRVERELSLLSDRALADLGLFRSDIAAFARNAGQIPGAEPVRAALTADLRALLEGRSSLASLWRTSSAA